ncbi:ArpU family phage packaging/lysis transcriptional regulator [Enterococcus gallinarum]|uniref:ArpU family phage packaging/lysis transcriptional regulator n=1 Tax=Enterococcus gallinarum TaxID=1353 RepID=UPI000496B30C|nr:ArpU family phage packaging/lysis transcriptional regulator [Enterococcus gallinarum]
MMLLREIDFRRTRQNAKSILRNYRRLERIAGRSKIDVRSPIITDMPKTPSNGNKSEDAIIQMMDAEAKRDAIVVALLALGIDSRQVLYYSYCTVDRYSNVGIAQQMGCSVRTIEDYKATALIEFAEAYRKGKLIAYC